MSALQATCHLAYDGVVVDAHAANVQLDGEGHILPALCVTLELESRIPARLSVRQFFPVGAMSGCEAAARRLKPGMRLTVEVSAPSIVINGVAKHIHLHQEEEIPA